jgi:hypothetical protein
MTNDLHAHAETLIAKERVEGISPAEQEWLSKHLGECAQCTESANAMQQALRSLRTLNVSVPRELAARTQFRVRLRAQELQAREPRWRLIWAMCGASWVAGAATAPYVWRGLEWIGHRTGMPDPLWKMGFGVWWALPAIVAAAVLLMEGGERTTRKNVNGAA